MSKRDVPEPWAGRMVKLGFVDPRNGQPSMRALAEAVESTTTTISEMMYATRDTKGDLVRRVAAALEVSPVDIATWIGRRAFNSDPFEPHPDADLLTLEERRAVNELIRVIASSRKARRRPEDATSLSEAIALRQDHSADEPSPPSRLLAMIDEYQDANGRPSDAAVARQFGIAPKMLASWRKLGLQELPDSDVMVEMARVMGRSEREVSYAAGFDVGQVVEVVEEAGSSTEADIAN